jgi:hypothetical protein
MKNKHNVNAGFGRKVENSMPINNNGTGHANGGGTSPSSNGGVSGTSTNGAGTNGALNGSAFASDSYSQYAQSITATCLSILGSGIAPAMTSTVYDTRKLTQLIGPKAGPNTKDCLVDIVDGQSEIRDGLMKLTQGTTNLMSQVLHLEEHPNQLTFGQCSCEGDALESQAVSVEPTAKVETEKPESPPDTQTLTDLDTGVTVTSTSPMEINLDAGVKVVTPTVKPNQPVRLNGLCREPGLMVVTIPRGETPAVTTSKAEKTILDPICIADRNDARATLVSDDKELIRVGSSALPAGEYDMFSIYPTGEVSQVNDVTITVVDGEVSDAVEAAFEDTLKIVSTDAQKPLTSDTLLPDETLDILADPGTFNYGDRILLLNKSIAAKVVKEKGVFVFDVNTDHKSNRHKFLVHGDDLEHIQLVADRPSSVLKHGDYDLFHLKQDGTVNRINEKDIRVPQKHSVPRLAHLSGFGESTLYHGVLKGTIPEAHVVYKRPGGRLYDLYDVAVDDLMAAGKVPKIQSNRFKLQDYLSNR